MLTRVDVALRPAECGRFKADAWVVVDLFRATTSIATLFGRGLVRLTVCATLPLAREIARREGALLCGEEGGLPPAGFDYGNSPVEFNGLDLGGRAAVLATTNGTNAICTAVGKGEVFAGALANLSALVDTLAAYGSAVVVCAGNGGGETLSLEDLGAAGAIVDALTAACPGLQAGDAALLARLAWTNGGPALLASSEHAATIRRLGLDADIEFALTANTSRAVPRVVESGPGYAVLG